MFLAPYLGSTCLLFSNWVVSLRVFQLRLDCVYWSHVFLVVTSQHSIIFAAYVTGRRLKFACFWYHVSLFRLWHSERHKLYFFENSLPPTTKSSTTHPEITFPDNSSGPRLFRTMRHLLNDLLLHGWHVLYTRGYCSVVTSAVIKILLAWPKSIITQRHWLTCIKM